MEAWIISTYASHHYLIYALILVVGFLEGPYVSMVCGAILSLGFLNFWPLYIALMIGDLIGDVMWYFIGYRFGERFALKYGKYFKLNQEHITRIKTIFHKHKNPLLFLSKISNGMGFALAVLFTAGMSRINFWKFIAVNALGQLMWSGILIAVGFFFGNLYMSINNVMGKISILVVFAIFIFAVIRFIKYLREKANL
ncbi:MAG: DedA family protein [Patescibacteria group bacterium]